MAETQQRAVTASPVQRLFTRCVGGQRQRDHSGWRLAPWLCTAALLAACAAPRTDPMVSVPPRWVPVPDLVAQRAADADRAASSAQLPTLPSSAPENLPAQASSAALLKLSDQSLRLIDGGQWQALWDSTPAFLRSTQSAQQLQSALLRAREGVGAVSGRARAGAHGLRMVQVHEPVSGPNLAVALPPGIYANVEYSSQSAQRGAVLERLSFVFEPSGWRFMGYAIGPAPAQSAVR